MKTTCDKCGIVKIPHKCHQDTEQDKEYMAGALCGQDCFHPYECNHDKTCPHCARAVFEGHDPATCSLCDPEYDLAPNKYWKK